MLCLDAERKMSGRNISGKNKRGKNINGKCGDFKVVWIERSRVEK